MILFPIMIITAWIFIIGFNILFNINGFEIWYIVMATVVSTLSVILIDALTATVVRLLPKKWFKPFSRRFKVFKWEKNFYQKLGIKKWKELVPEIGHFTGFRKNEIKEPTNNKYIERYLLEINYGRVGHFASFFTGFLIMFIFPLNQFINFALPVALVNILMNAMSWTILRYNTPKLLALHKFNSKRENITDTTKKTDNCKLEN